MDSFSSLRFAQAPERLRLRGFAPVVGAKPRVLVLGSMPSEASLRAGEYYAHPRNRFWPVAARSLGFPEGLAYPERLEALKDGSVALWDAIGSCEREGSLDSAILRPECNPIDALLAAKPSIGRVLLNGGMAARMWDRFAAKIPAVADAVDSGRVEVVRLPSTSPANARFSLERLLEVWRPVLHTP